MRDHAPTRPEDDREVPDDRIRGPLLEAFAIDQNGGGLRPVGSYQERFPGWEDAVARLYAEFSRPDDAEAVPDERRFGPYRPLRGLGRGGQGVVYLAEDERLGRRVALKLLPSLGPATDRLLLRFKREAEAAAKLDHPGICPIYDAGVAHGVPYLAMRYVEGETLGTRLAELRESGGLEIPAMAALIEGVARALHAVHEAGITHRDVKPGNIMIGPGGDPVIMDFGLARDEDSELETVTRSGDLLGTPAYMAPEQLSGQLSPLDRRVDVWSLGAVLYESVTLERPFEAPTREALFRQILGHDPRPPHRVDPGIGRDLSTVILTALEKNPDRRYRTAELLADELGRIREGRPVLARRVTLLGRFLRWSRRQPAAAALVLLLACGVPAVSLLGAYVLRNLDRVRAEEARETKAEVERHVLDGFQALDDRDPERARASFARSLALAPFNEEALGGTALAWLAERRPEETIRSLERWGARSDRSAGLAACKRFALREAGRGPGDQAAPEPVSPSDHFLLALVEVGYPLRFVAKPSALASLNMAIELSEPRLLYSVFRARVSQPLVLDENVRSQYADILPRLWPDSHDAWYGHALLQVNDLTARAASFERAILLAPEHAPSRTGLALCRRQMGEPGSGIEAAESVLTHDPRNADALWIKADCLLDLGRPAAALVTAELGLSVLPRSSFLKATRARCLSRLGRWSEAERARSEVLSRAAEMSARRCLGIAWGTTAIERPAGSPKESEECLREASFSLALAREGVRRSKRTDADQFNCLGITLYRVASLGAESDASSMLEEALQAFRDSERACSITGRPLFSSDASFAALCHHALGRPELARQRLAIAGARLESDWSSYAVERVAYAEARRAVEGLR